MAEPSFESPDIKFNVRCLLTARDPESGELMVLMTQRSLDSRHSPGEWSAPGGGVDSDRSLNELIATLGSGDTDILLDTARRELDEELQLSLDTSKLRLLNAYTSLKDINPNGCRKWTVFYYVSPYPDTRPISEIETDIRVKANPGEIMDVKFVRLSELKAGLMDGKPFVIAFPQQKEAIIECLENAAIEQ